jgi:hypothetical protein
LFETWLPKLTKTMPILMPMRYIKHVRQLPLWLRICTIFKNQSILHHIQMQINPYCTIYLILIVIQLLWIVISRTNNLYLVLVISRTNNLYLVLFIHLNLNEFKGRWCTIVSVRLFVYYWIIQSRSEVLPRLVMKASCHLFMVMHLL